MKKFYLQHSPAQLPQPCLVANSVGHREAAYGTTPSGPHMGWFPSGVRLTQTLSATLADTVGTFQPGAVIDKHFWFVAKI